MWWSYKQENEATPEFYSLGSPTNNDVETTNEKRSLTNILAILEDFETDL